jgi:hypothetical protein
MNIETKEISFCDRQTENVINNLNKEFILNKIKNYSIDLDFKSAIILNNKLLKNVTYHPHLITTKSSGTNYFLFLTNINDINYCFYIDRKIKQGYNFPRIISTKYRFDDIVFKDTLIDGEIIKDKHNNWIFLISDLLVYKGEKITCNITSRYSIINSILENHYINDSNMEICPIFLKRIFKYSEWDTLVTDFIPNLNYNIRGLYFNTLNQKCTNYLYLFPRDYKFSSKKVVENNVTLFIQKTESSDIYNTYCLKENNKHLLGIAHISSILISKKIRKLLISDTEIKMACTYSDKFQKWEPKELSESNVTDFTDLPS